LIGVVSTTFVLPGGARVATPLVVRVAGLPVGTLRRMRFERSYSRVCELVRLQEWLSAEGDAIADALHTVIGDSSVAERKPALVGLRRAVHKLRMPKHREWNVSIAAALGDELAGRLTGWMSRLRERERLAAELPDVLTSETRVKRSVLREIARDHGFRRALAQASPSLFGELTKWLADEAHCPQRQSLVRLARYITRAASKTSPYSTFTVIGTGSWSVDGPSVRFAEPAPDVRGVVELNGLLMQRLIRALCERTGVAHVLRPRVNPSATVVDDTVRFLGPSPKEPIVTVPATSAVRECLRILEDEQVSTMGDLVDRLAAKAGAPEQVERFLGRLVNAGLIERQLPVADLAADPLRELADWLTANAHGELGDVVPVVNRVRKELCSPAPVDDVAGHCEHRQALGDAIGGLVAGADFPLEAIAGQQKGIFCEDAVFTEPVATCSMSHWRPALTDLDVVRRMLAPLDPTLPLRVALGAYCGERFGPGCRVPLLVLHAAVAEELSRGALADRNGAMREIAGFIGVAPVPAARLADSPLARLREIDRIQAEIHGLMLPSATEKHVVRVDPAAVGSLAEGWPEWMTAPSSIGCYVQVVPDPESLRLVVNAAHGGHGRGRSRAMHLIRQAGGTDVTGTGTGTGEESADDTLLAELGGMFAFSPNVRQPSVSHEIDYPFTSSARPASQRIPLGDLVVAHDLGTNMVRLVSRRLDAEVIPLHLGMMADGLLPPAARLLTQVFGATYYVHPSQPLLVTADMFAMSDEVVVQDRMDVGRIVLQRARWIVPTARVPVRTKGESDADYVVRMVAWLRAHGIAERCFVRMWASAEDLRMAGGPTTKWLTDKSRKPVYVDFANWYLVLAFERMLNGPVAVVVFEEALPAPEDALGLDPRDPSVTEFLVELSAEEASHA
jgi:lantibiotic biosynthesis dehydratase-like protein